jgi:hypothetical protein
VPGFLLLFAITTKLTGTLVLPSGETLISTPIELPAGAHDLEVKGNNTVIRMADDFDGAAAIVCRDCRNVAIHDVTITGGKADPLPIPPWDEAFADFFPSNGILIVKSDGVQIRGVSVKGIPNFAVIVSASKNVHLQSITVEDTGSLMPNGKNNTSGGILFEEGTTSFSVRQSTFRNIRGNALWTHSREVRNSSATFAENTFSDIGRDAIQVGHATGIHVDRNSGKRIGYPIGVVDPNGMPVAIDTAGNVDASVYSGNRFEEVNGKCIDLDGFHDSSVTGNTCVNVGHYGIVFNNTNANMQSRKILVERNTVDGAKYGGIFVIGEDHTIAGNKFLRLNQAHCNQTANCIYLADEPDLLRSGIYFGRKAERPDPAKHNTVRDNVISGFGMDKHCFGYAPGITRKNESLERNQCKP